MSRLFCETWDPRCTNRTRHPERSRGDPCNRQYPRPVQFPVNRQNLHDRLYLLATKAEIFPANMSQSPFAN